jgi:hypothetical protein
MSNSEMVAGKPMLWPSKQSALGKMIEESAISVDFGRARSGEGNSGPKKTPRQGGS